MKSYKIRFEFTALDYLNDVQDIVRGFAPLVEIDENSEDFLRVVYSYQKPVLKVTINSSFYKETSSETLVDDEILLLYKKYSKRFIKNSIYRYLSEALEFELPYGSLTGVRPTKLFYDLSEAQTDVKRYLKEQFCVSESRVALIASVVENQNGIYCPSLKNVDVFVNIPFCPTRCEYCSFISSEVFRVKKELPRYAEYVNREINVVLDEIKKKGHTLRSIYVGGGTPTSIPPDLLNEILSPLKGQGVEFTVEAGRPDTVTTEILSVLKANDVTRISVNPQSFNDKTLEKIGRKHTVEQVYSAYAEAKQFGFSVNMDLIAMLADEGFDEFRNSVDKAIELSPDNVTIHTLSLKRGAKLDCIALKSGDARRMVDYAYEKLSENGYFPYYMYRQKNMADNLENVGFCKENKQCVYNVDMMEETNSIIGAGAGAMTKVFLSEGRIERQSNPKGLREYLDNFETNLQKKLALYK